MFVVAFISVIFPTLVSSISLSVIRRGVDHQRRSPLDLCILVCRTSGGSFPGSMATHSVRKVKPSVSCPAMLEEGEYMIGECAECPEVHPPVHEVHRPLDKPQRDVLLARATVSPVLQRWCEQCSVRYHNNDVTIQLALSALGFSKRIAASASQIHSCGIVLLCALYGCKPKQTSFIKTSLTHKLVCDLQILVSSNLCGGHFGTAADTIFRTDSWAILSGRTLSRGDNLARYIPAQIMGSFAPLEKR